MDDKERNDEPITEIETSAQPEKRKGSRTQQPKGEELVQIRRRAKTILAKELPSYDCTSLGLRESTMKLLVIVLMHSDLNL